MQSAAEFGNKLAVQADKGGNLQPLAEEELEKQRAEAMKQEREQVKSIFSIFQKSKKGSGRKSKRSSGAGTSSETKATSRERMGLQKEDSLQG